MATKSAGPRKPWAVRGPNGRLFRVLPSAIAMDSSTMEVMAWVGFALVWAQALERTLAAYLSFAWPANVAATTPQFRKFVRRAQERTAGDLIKGLQKCSLPADESTSLAALRRIVTQRDRLAHHFLRQPSGRDLLRTAEGRAKLIREARYDADDFRIATNRVALWAADHAFRLDEQTEHLRAHADWLRAAKEDIQLRGGKQAFDPTLATEIGQLMESIARRT